MSALHFFDTQAMEWTPHPRFPTILTKALQSRAENEVASVTLVRVDVGGVIDLHVHEVETETAYVLSGQGRLTTGENEHMLAAGTGVTVPPGTPHSLTNTGDEPMELYALHMPPFR